MLKGNCNVERDLVNATLYDTAVRMLAILRYIPMISKLRAVSLISASDLNLEIPVKALISLSCLVAYPRYYPAFADNLSIHRAVERLFSGNADGMIIFSSNEYNSDLNNR